jgi:phosphoenolpyruvate---glycerone phosphotransferase subunit DhaL
VGGIKRMAVDRDAVLAWFAELQRVYAANKEHLTELDSAIGDADHGSNMDRGFSAVQAELVKDSSANIGTIFKTAAVTLMKTVGGASGPLYGTFFLRASGVCQDKTELDAPDVVALFRAGIEGIVQRGKGSPRDKTLLDALLPALDAMQSGLVAGANTAEILACAAAAAEDGMQGTIPMQARKGRASYLGPRSVGHADPGATSSYLMIRAAANVWCSA